MTYDKAADRDGDSPEQRAARRKALEIIRSKMDYRTMDTAQLLAAYIDLLDGHRAAIVSINKVVGRGSGGGHYRLKVSIEEARNILARLTEGKF